MAKKEVKTKKLRVGSRNSSFNNSSSNNSLSRNSLSEKSLFQKILAPFYKLRNYVRRYYHYRKLKEENLPPWKRKWHDFNETKLSWLERIVEKAIPWLVLLIGLILLGEFAREINVFGWPWLEVVGEFFEKHEKAVNLIDNIVVGFFIIDIYFNFFKKKTFWAFFKSSFIDLIAIAPLGLIFRLTRFGEAQSVLHVTAELEKEVSVVAKEGEAASKIVKAEELVKVARAEKAVRLGRLGRLLRLLRLHEFGRANAKSKKKIRLKNNKISKGL